MSNREAIAELAGIYIDTLNRGHGVITRFEQGNRAAETILAAGYRKPRTITTEAELESLPVGSVIWAFDYQAGDSNSWQLFDDVLNLRDEEGDLAKTAWLSSAYKDEHASNRILLRTNGRPIIVLLEGEAQA